MNIKKRAFAAAAVMALAAAGVLISGSHNIAQAGPGSAPVSITSPLPLPITGTATVSGTVGATQSGTWNVGISGTPNVTAAQGGTWNVGITGTPSVNVTDTVAVRNVDEKGRIPYMQNVDVGCLTSVFCDAVYPPVPAGMRLVVEHVSANIFVNPGGVNATFLFAANRAVRFSLPGRSMAAPNLVGVNEQVLAYYEAGEQPTYEVVFSTPSNSGSVGSAISGYLINLSQ